jgi:replicative DNA helicase
MVDYLGYYSRGRRGNNQYEKVSDATMQLKAEAKDHRCAVIAPHQVNRGAKDGHPLSAEEARDSGVVEETADWMMGLYRPGEAGEHAGNVTSSLNLNILKGRRGGKGRVINLGMSNLSLAIVDKHDRKSMARIDMENAEYNRGTKYDDWLRDQRAIADGRAQMRLVD